MVEDEVFVMMFLSACHRDLAVPAPTPGVWAYLYDDNVVTRYRDGAWTPIGDDRG